MSRLFFVLISLITSQAHATNVENLYQAQAEITTQDEQERQKLIPEILQKVLSKVVGDSDALANKDMSPLLEQSDRFVKQYAYVKRYNLGNEAEQSLSLIFNEQSLNDSLRAMGLPVWGSSRPEVLFWLVIREGSQETVFGTEQMTSPLITVIKQQVDIRGVPLFLPLMDLVDEEQLKLADSSEELDKNNLFTLASVRYAPKVILLGVVNEQEGKTSVTWQWLVDGQHHQFKTEGELFEALQSGINEFANKLADQFIVVEKKYVKQVYQLHISQVDDYEDFSHVTSYLSNLKYVSKVNVRTLEASELEVSIVLEAGLRFFEQVIEEDGLLSKKRLNSGVSNLEYRLNP
jgi:hypothetical protein|tara:strand:+ start:566 stop:1609 length:1044 start_codon:yes stop_codon:yes gene_type:complete